ncbi:MAG: tRNA pseudouridine(13) synthase TruD [Gammaproteobacteria bacterium]
MSFDPWKDVPFAHGGPAATGLIRCEPGDFLVEEDLGFEPSGAGEHLFLRLRQVGCNTRWVAGRLARWARRPARDVGYAGLKDRHAVTEQWFSVRCPGGRHPDPDGLEVPGVTLVDWCLGDRKLRPGALAGNRFVIRVRNLAGDRQTLEARLSRIRSSGAPNPFGPQRFGRDSGNLERARAWFAGGDAPRRAERAFALSAARALIFNAVLADRLSRGSWDTAGDGEPVQLEGSRSWFLADGADEALPGRLSALDVHPTGPLWGQGLPPGKGGEHEAELATAGEHGLFAVGLESAGLDQDRRPLRVRVRDLDWAAEGDVITLAFRLPPGSYATAVLREAVDAADNAQRASSRT